MNFFAFLAEPGFVVAWYAIGLLAGAWVWHDQRTSNTPLKTAIQWAWPIVVLFFSVLGLLLYFTTARAPGVAQARDEDEKKVLHDRYERSMIRRVNGAVIHCVAGDGLGIMTAMVIARLAGLEFWQEFWFEYVVGFGFGWLIFQYKAMTMMTDSKPKALAMAFRGEFFSMLTVMGGMGAVMTWITPMTVGMQPKPDTAAFWGFGMLGLLVGYVATFPMNWMMVKIGWKHGMGSPEGAKTVAGNGPRLAFVAAMGVLGLAATLLPGYLVLQSQRHQGEVARSAVAEYGSVASLNQDPTPLERGLGADLEAAGQQLRRGNRSEANASMDNALRVAEVLQASGRPPGAQAVNALGQARAAVQNGRPKEAQQWLATIAAQRAGGSALATHARAPDAYEGSPLLNASGAVIGEVRRIESGQAILALGGVSDFLGFWDLGDPHMATVPVPSLVFGPAPTVGKTFVLLPTLQDPMTVLGALN